MTEGCKIKQTPILVLHALDTTYKIVKIDDDSYVYIQYGPDDDGNTFFDKLQVYSKVGVKEKIMFLEGYSTISPLEMFDKFDKL
jgi:hypothetical protein